MEAQRVRFACCVRRSLTRHSRVILDKLVYVDISLMKYAMPLVGCDLLW